MKVQSNKISIKVEDSGDTSRPVVLLIMGLGMQLTSWPEPLVAHLLEAGYRVVRFDNRDIGLSSHFDQLGRPKVAWAALRTGLGLPVRPPYTLSDMSADAIGVLDALHIKKAHVVGVSMGGMIAQRVAMAAPTRVLSLTSIMSSSGARGLPTARADISLAMIRRPTTPGKQASVEHTVKLLRRIGSPNHLNPVELMRDRVGQNYDRSFHPVGTLRQMVAIMADTERAHHLHKITAPTLVIHGNEDPLVPHACGVDTAKRIPGAKLVTIPGMGHDLALSLLPTLCATMCNHFAQATAKRKKAGPAAHATGPALIACEPSTDTSC